MNNILARQRNPTPSTDYSEEEIEIAKAMGNCFESSDSIQPQTTCHQEILPSLSELLSPSPIEILQKPILPSLKELSLLPQPIKTPSLPQKKKKTKPIALIREPDELHRLPNSLHKAALLLDRGYPLKGQWEDGVYVIQIKTPVKNGGILEGKFIQESECAHRFFHKAFSCYELWTVADIKKDQVFAHINVIEVGDNLFKTKIDPIKIQEVYGHIKVPSKTKSIFATSKRIYQVIFTDSKDYFQQTRVYAKTTTFEIMSGYRMKHLAFLEERAIKYSRQEQ